jgi:hypothetical protein
MLLALMFIYYKYTPVVAKSLTLHKSYCMSALHFLVLNMLKKYILTSVACGKAVL